MLPLSFLRQLTGQPKLAETLRGYTWEGLRHDILAGVTVGVLAIPLAMAFAIASGVPPTLGIWTSIVAGFFAALLSGSRVVVSGPTGAFIPIVYGIVVTYGVSNMLVATMLAGLILIAMGLARIGNLIRYIPLTVVIGFTNGIAVVIFISQIKDFFGLPAELPAGFFAKMQAIFLHIHEASLPTFALSMASLALILAWNRAARRIRVMAFLPGPLAAMLLVTAFNTLFPLPVETIGSRFGGIPQQLPNWSLPDFSLFTLGKLIAPALTIALLGAIESLLAARVADNQIGDRHNPNQELLAQGVSNLLSPMFGGYTSTGAIARTSTNVRSGGHTPVAGIAHALTILAMVLIAAPLAAKIPISVLSAIVVVTALHMGEWHEFVRLRMFSWGYRSVVLTSFLLTVLFDLTLAVEIGIAVAGLSFIYRIQSLTTIEPINLGETLSARKMHAFRISGSFFFGSVAKIETQLDLRKIDAKIIVLDMEQVINLDTSGLEVLQTLHRDLEKRGGALILCGLNSQPRSIVERSGLAATLGNANIVNLLAEALVRAAQL